jgi:hypothetical protein
LWRIYPITEIHVSSQHIHPVAKLLTFLSAVTLASLALADTTSYQDWATGVSSDGSYLSALTANFNSDVLAEFCYQDKHCEWRFGTKGFSCEVGAKSVMLVNAATGTNAITTECIGEIVKGSWTSRIVNWSAFETVLVNNQDVAFAIAGQGTAFRVIRFSLRGMPAATASIGGAINPNAPAAGTPASARDETL